MTIEPEKEPLEARIARIAAKERRRRNENLLLLAIIGVLQAFAMRSMINPLITYSGVAAATGEALVNGPTVFESLLAIGLAVFTVALIVETGFYRRWIFWKSLEPPEPRWRTMVAALVAVLLLVGSFSAVTVVLAQLGVVEVSKFHHGSLSPKASRVLHRSPRTGIYSATESIYVWNFLDAFPSLKVPQTLNWPQTGHKLTNKPGGVVLLLFKVLAVLPLVGALVQIFSRPNGPRSPLAEEQDSSTTGAEAAPPGNAS